ncbi:MAG: single-stranded-DNA-specific exonuclease RecJ [Spirochaetales bacterium]|nr:single-stranded-DNA-specific exonuclease RecJ [Spirochaetales bacterium]
MIWEKKEIEGKQVKALAKKYNIDLLVASIVMRRNLNKGQSLCFFLENDIRFLHNPFLFSEMEEAVERINLAVLNGEAIFVFGDRDVDGITATVLLVRLLRERGAKVLWGLPEGDDSYGLSRELIDSIAEKNVSLLVSVDCGISNIDEIEYAGEKGIDTIVVDHHNPHEYLPEACAVINPKVEESGYPFKDLCGCAVTSKVVWALHFSRTRYYGIPIFLLHIKPANESYVIDMVRLVNLVERDRIRENVVPGVVSFEKTRLFRFCEGNDVYVYREENQKKQLAVVFGDTFTPNIFDIEPLITKIFPALKDNSLYKIQEKSRIAFYADRQSEEIDVFASLFISYVIKSEKTLSVDYCNDMDLVALGTLGDIMPLVDENRIFVKLGLSVLNKTKRRGLREILFRNSLCGKELDSKDVSWYVTPVINASGRMGEPEKAAQMLLTDDEKESEELAAYIIKLNDKRKNLGEEVWGKVIPGAKRCFEETEEKFIYVSGTSIHRGITGIIASRLSKFFKVPALVVALLEKRAVGSIRSTLNVNAKEFLHSFGDLLTDFGGHDLAGGFTMGLDKMERFESRFQEVVKEMEPVRRREDVVTVDAELPTGYLTPDIWSVIEFFKPYGEGNPPLVFLTREVAIRSCEVIGRREQVHLKLLFEAGKYKWPAVFWNSADRVGRDFSEGDSVDIVYNISKNYYQQTETIRLNILDIKKNTSP